MTMKPISDTQKNEKSFFKVKNIFLISKMQYNEFIEKYYVKLKTTLGKSQ